MAEQAKEIVGLVFDKLEQYFDASKQVIETYGGDVAELGLAYIRVDAFITLAGFLLLVCTCVVGTKLIVFGYKISNYELYSGEEGKRLQNLYKNDIEVGVYATGVAVAVFGGVGVIVQLTSGLWALIGMFYPEVYAVHLVIK